MSKLLLNYRGELAPDRGIGIKLMRRYPVIPNTLSFTSRSLSPHRRK